MKRTSLTLAAFALLGLSGILAVNVLTAANAEDSSVQTAAKEQTQTFAIENMTCAACPITVKKAMQGVEGVKTVEVDFEAKTATVTFNSDVATSDAIATASANAGYPAHASSGG